VLYFLIFTCGLFKELIKVDGKNMRLERSILEIINSVFERIDTDTPYNSNLIAIKVEFEKDKGFEFLENV